jgi:hypothetical protein
MRRPVLLLLSSHEGRLGGDMSAKPTAMSDEQFYALAYPKQNRRFYLALVFSVLLFPLIAALLVAGTVFLVVPFVVLCVWLAARTLFAHLVGNTVLVSALNYPRVQAIVEELKVSMGYDKPVYVFVYESSSFNAFLRHMFFRRAIFLNSELLETGVSDNEMRWLVGRFIGYLRARRQAGVLGLLIRAAQHALVFNLFLLPYERAMVYPATASRSRRSTATWRAQSRRCRRSSSGASSATRSTPKGSSSSNG